MRRLKVELTASERQKVSAFRSKGTHSAREVNRAHILAALDQGIADQQIAQVLGVSRVVIWRTRSAYQERGLDYALHDEQRSGAPHRYQTAQEAEVVALACVQPPVGQKRWTIKTLTEAAQKQPQLDHVSRETIRRWLKKTF
jgi:transposase